LMLIVDAELGKWLETAVSVASEHAESVAGDAFVIGARGEGAFSSRMQKLLRNKEPLAVRNVRNVARLTDQMRLEYDLILEVVRTYGMCAMPKKQIMISAARSNPVLNPVVTSWRVWNAIGRRIARTILDLMVQKHLNDQPPWAEATDRLKEQRLEDIESIKEALASVLARLDLSADEMKEIVRASYEKNTTHSAEIAGALGVIAFDSSGDIAETLGEIEERIKARYG
jgi:hypothetical protein